MPGVIAGRFKNDTRRPGKLGLFLFESVQHFVELKISNLTPQNRETGKQVMPYAPL